jgi:spore photoproduct lyase
MKYRPERLVIEKEVADSPLVKKILATSPGIPVDWVDRVQEDVAAENGSFLEIVKFSGRFIKPCPGTRFYNCCGYQILNLGIQCSLGCTYCILQAYFTSPNLRLFANLYDAIHQLTEHLDNSPQQIHRIGTGEFTDSLLLDPLIHLSEQLVPFFAAQQRAVLELKTKTAQVDLLEKIDHRGHTIVAWSLNPSDVIAEEEAGAAALEERLGAAKRCQEWGYRVAFHFDPLLAYPGWQQGYQEVVDRLFSAVDPGGIAWISLGTLRFMPSLKTIIQQRYPNTSILDEEFIPGLDGKLRYFRDLRVEMYAYLNELLGEVHQDLCVYLCMVSDDVWREAFGFTPAERGGLSGMLDRRALSSSVHPAI